MTIAHDMTPSAPPVPTPTPKQTPPPDSIWLRAARHPLIWPLGTLALILAVNASLNPGLWHLQWRDGHLCAAKRVAGRGSYADGARRRHHGEKALRAL